MKDIILGGPSPKRLLFTLVFLLLYIAGHGQSKWNSGSVPPQSSWPRLNPAKDFRKGKRPNQILMTGQDTSVYYFDADTVLRLGGAPDFYYSTPVITTTLDSLRIRTSQWDPGSGFYITAPFGGQYIDNVVNKKVSYQKINDSTWVYYQPDFENDTIIASGPPKDTLLLSYYGAKSGPVDIGVRHANTAAFATAWNRIKDIGGVIVVDGIYDIDSLDLQNTNPSNFSNTDIVGTASSVSGFRIYSTGIAVGCEGRNWLEIRDIKLQFMSNPEVGILYCRTASSSNCNNNALINVEILGSAQKSLMATIAAESFRMFHSKITNSSIVGGSCYITSVDNNTFGIQASSEAIFGSSNTDIVLFGTEFYSAIDSCKVLIMDRAADIKFMGCSFIVGNQAGSSIANFSSSVDVFEGVVLFDGCLFEASENPFKFVMNFSPNYFRNINVRNCFVNNYGFIGGVYTDVVKYTGAGYVFHYNFNWEGNRFSDLNPKLKTGILIHSKIYHKTNGATFEPSMIIQCDVDVLSITNTPTIQDSRVMVAGVGIYKHLPQIDNYLDADYIAAPVGAMLVWSASNTLSQTPGNLHIKQ